MAVQELWEASKNSSHHCVFIIACFALLEKLQSSHLSVPCVPGVCSLEEMGWQSILPLVQALKHA